MCLAEGWFSLLFVRFLVLFSFFVRLFGMLGEQRLLVTLVLGLYSGVVGISGLSLFFEALILASPERKG